MAPWVVLALILLTVALTSSGTWLLLRHFSRQLRCDFEGRSDGLRVGLDGLREQAWTTREHLLRALEVHFKEQRQWIEAKSKSEEGWTGVFLPTDQSAAEMEQQIKASEDRAISASEPIRYSSQPSPRSGPTSRRVPSTQRVQSSGRP